jgi:hypothetical protein
MVRAAIGMALVLTVISLSAQVYDTSGAVLQAPPTSLRCPIAASAQRAATGQISAIAAGISQDKARQGLHLQFGQFNGSMRWTGRGTTPADIQQLLSANAARRIHSVHGQVYGSPAKPLIVYAAGAPPVEIAESFDLTSAPGQPSLTSGDVWLTKLGGTRWVELTLWTSWTAPPGMRRRPRAASSRPARI